MMKRLLSIVMVSVAALFIWTGCSKESFKTYTVTSEIVLGDPQVDLSDLSITLSAVYNGDDSGIAGACFTVRRDGEDASAARTVACDWADGKAEARLTGLESGYDYWINFVVTTTGGNNISAEEDKYCPFSRPANFAYSTVNTVTSKILQVAYTGADVFIEKADLILFNSAGERVNGTPAFTCYNGVGKALFVLSEWEEDLYTFHCEMTLYDGSHISSPDGLLNLLPVPESCTLAAVAVDGDTFTFSASYDGEDKTVARAVFTLFDRNGAVLHELEGTCANRKATATLSGNEYGRYSALCTLYLVDDSILESNRQTFTHARPRAYETLLLEPVPMSEAGMATSSDSNMNKFEYMGYEWEYKCLYARTSSGVTTLYVKSDEFGIFQNATPFENGIRTVYINHTSGKDTPSFKCYGKAEAGDEWTELDEAVKVGYVFIYDLSGDNYRYFQFESREKSNGGAELKANSFEVEYYTEAPEEY